VPEEEPSTHSSAEPAGAAGEEWESDPETNKGQRSYACGKVMHVDAEVAQENPRVVLDMFLVNSTPASVLFDSGHAILSLHLSS
jgi:hypothetical protein